ncbi:uncharacterized protein TNCV_109671 [Trichonephila clavipes]|nr:uncharacterized protein TNCV_109671 [Trichonephila clavipes]
MVSHGTDAWHRTGAEPIDSCWPEVNYRLSGVKSNCLMLEPCTAVRDDPEFVKCIFERIISNRIDEENKQKEQTLREFELQKIRLQNETQRVVGPQTLPQKIELKKLLPTFNPEVDNMDLFLTLFERQMKLLDLGEDLWVPYLIGALPSDVTFLIAREPVEKFRDYSHIRGMLLQRFKLTAEKFRELFSRHRKKPKWDVEGLLF